MPFKLLKMSGVSRHMKFYATRHTFATNFYKQTKDVIPSLGDKITFQEGSSKAEEPSEPEPEPFGIEDWEGLYDDDIF